MKESKIGKAATKTWGNKQILKRRGEYARREAEKTKARGMPWDHDMAAARRREDIELKMAGNALASNPPAKREVEGTRRTQLASGEPPLNKGEDGEARRQKNTRVGGQQHT